MHGWARRELARRWRGPRGERGDGAGGAGTRGAWGDRRQGRARGPTARGETAVRARGTSSARGWGRRVARTPTHIMLVGHAPLLHVQHLHLHDAAPRRHGRSPRPAPCGPGWAKAILAAEHLPPPPPPSAPRPCALICTPIMHKVKVGSRFVFPPGFCLITTIVPPQIDAQKCGCSVQQAAATIEEGLRGTPSMLKSA